MLSLVDYLSPIIQHSLLRHLMLGFKILLPRYS